MHKHPFISVIMPVYNGEAYIEDALNSIFDQQYSNLEIIIVDDGSTDRTAEIIQAKYPHVLLLHQSNQGPASAKNLGIAHATGEYFAFLDADDLWIDKKIQSQVEKFNTNPELDIVFGHVVQFYSEDASMEIRSKYRCNTEKMPAYIDSAMIIKRESFMRVGNYDSSLKKGIFVDWYARAMEHKLKIDIVDEIVLRRRIHGNNMGIKRRQSYSDYVKIIKQSLDRRRTLTQ